ncbi:6253_t:CDS:2 [Ambispora gerdemannii]|uniref:6253_t:CDS:1 n=1 Tax=Ambispora gerdemannii TaxID=144530 RepID=A0A9N8YU08_9GLOM|nr:6253_t:CDS:2 [Ambispora gerdemannii]
MSRQRLTKDKKSSTTSGKPTPIDTIAIHFAREIDVKITKSRIIYEKLQVFIEERVRFVHTFNFPYSVLYHDRAGNEHVIENGERGDEAVKQIKDLLESEEGEYVSDLYIMVDKSGGIKTWLFYNVDTISFLITLTCVIGLIFSTRFEVKAAVYLSGAFLAQRMVKHVELPGLPNFVKKYLRK